MFGLFVVTSGLFKIFQRWWMMYHRFKLFLMQTIGFSSAESILPRKGHTYMHTPTYYNPIMYKMLFLLFPAQSPGLFVASKVMAEFDRKLFILIVTFWIFVPTLDMVSDMTMVIRLFRGPEPDLVLSGGEWNLRKPFNWQAWFQNPSAKASPKSLRIKSELGNWIWAVYKILWVNSHYPLT